MTDINQDVSRHPIKVHKLVMDVPEIKKCKTGTCKNISKSIFKTGENFRE